MTNVLLRVGVHAQLSEAAAAERQRVGLIPAVAHEPGFGTTYHRLRDVAVAMAHGPSTAAAQAAFMATIGSQHPQYNRTVHHHQDDTASFLGTVLRDLLFDLDCSIDLTPAAPEQLLSIGVASQQEQAAAFDRAIQQHYKQRVSPLRSLFDVWSQTTEISQAACGCAVTKFACTNMVTVPLPQQAAQARLEDQLQRAFVTAPDPSWRCTTCVV